MCWAVKKAHWWQAWKENWSLIPTRGRCIISMPLKLSHISCIIKCCFVCLLHTELSVDFFDCSGWCCLRELQQRHCHLTSLWFPWPLLRHTFLLPHLNFGTLTNHKDTPWKLHRHLLQRHSFHMLLLTCFILFKKYIFKVQSTEIVRYSGFYLFMTINSHLLHSVFIARHDRHWTTDYTQTL